MIFQGLLFWVLLVPPAAPTIGGFQESPSLVEQGKARLATRDPVGALRLFAAAKLESPTDPEPYFYSGLVLSGMGQVRDAIAEIEGAVARDGKNGDYLLVYAELLARTNELAALESVLGDLATTEVRETLGFKAEGLWRLAALYMQLGQIDGALAVLEEHGVSNPGNPGWLIAIGELYLKDGRFGEALEVYEKLLNATTEERLVVQGRYGRGLACFRLNRPVEAEADLRFAVERSPSNAAFVSELAALLLQQGHPEEARDILLGVKEQGQQLPRILQGLGQAYRDLGDRETARDYLRQYQEAERAKKDRSAIQEGLRSRLSRARVSLKEGQMGQALDAFKEALELDPSNWTANSALARVYLESGRANLAEKYLVRMEQIESGTYEGLYLVSLYYYQMGQLALARGFADRALEKRPGSAELRNLIGNIYFGLGDPANALTEYHAATKLAPDRLEYRLNYESCQKKVE